MGIQSDSMSCVVEEAVPHPAVKFAMDQVKHFAAGLSWLEKCFSPFHDLDNPGMSRRLLFGGFSIDREGAAQVASIAPHSDADVQRNEFAGDDRTVRTGESTGSSGLKILTPS